MEHLILTEKEAFDMYIIVLDATITYKREIEYDIKNNVEKEIIISDERKLKLANKLLEFTRLSTKPLMISEIELPF